MGCDFRTRVLDPGWEDDEVLPRDPAEDAHICTPVFQWYRIKIGKERDPSGSFVGILRTRAASGNAAAAPPIRPMNSRRRIFSRGSFCGSVRVQTQHLEESRAGRRKYIWESLMTVVGQSGP